MNFSFTEKFIFEGFFGNALSFPIKLTTKINMINELRISMFNVCFLLTIFSAAVPFYMRYLFCNASYFYYCNSVIFCDDILFLFSSFSFGFIWDELYFRILRSFTVK